METVFGQDRPYDTLEIDRRVRGCFALCLEKLPSEATEANYESQ
jgi:hypothetical protein